MQIEKVLNNNVIISRDADNHEIVVMGKGLGFQMKPGMQVMEDIIEKVFRLEHSTDGNIDNRYHELLASIPMDLLLATEDIVKMAEHSLNSELHPSIRISLADHLHFALERCVQGKNIQNAMLWDIKKLYPKEYAIGLKALDIIKAVSGIQFPEDEAGFVALHIVNAQLSEDMHNTMDITSLISDIIQIVKYQLRINIDEDSLSYQRLVTHLKFFAHRMMHNTAQIDDDDSLFQSIRLQYPQSFECTQKVYLFVEEKFRHAMTQEEMMFLTIHIERVRRSI
ncbi:BglG family transcription antiterminator LicT [Vibrio palustris]|uniref:Transcription antiterminator LicT n=1 Tax=Vibrio palustris TaxID=1918946 RepID=A0A1R4B3L5_9VIBR|nr:PRD domain-containing protein [Vibrio palustris]SJL83495.1 Transcription antiterminator LicT [Vibrio palustris]